MSGAKFFVVSNFHPGTWSNLYKFYGSQHQLPASQFPLFAKFADHRASVLFAGKHGTMASLVILAAGMASRYGSMKQTEGFGPSGETLLEYSIYDAIQAGFGQVVFIIQRQHEDAFRSMFEPKLRGRINVAYAFQDKDAYMNGYTWPAERVKPWGTAHAVLCSQPVVREPFAVINADDFYGRDAFVRAATFLRDVCSPQRMALIGYELARTLSAHGSVSRGVCDVDEQGRLSGITERTKVYRHEAEIVYEDDTGIHPLGDKRVSMNFWCMHPAVYPVFEKEFHRFLSQNHLNPKSEFFIPIVADAMIKCGAAVFEVLPSSADWFGVTYREDAGHVRQSIANLIAKGEYPASLWT
ncbi:MAG: sugar phosphate nucleotidyltransferase [Chitinophagales bacterium]|nr:sugar phosphate nucleotidyltransferase [Chitinophagales bacterium]MDW8417949.1 sugar phosphate nucleotidyltransferase [Chitinophagales bacterium]